MENDVLVWDEMTQRPRGGLESEMHAHLADAKQIRVKTPARCILQPRPIDEHRRIEADERWSRL
jgi:hypothetical protein